MTYYATFDEVELDIVLAALDQYYDDTVDDQDADRAWDLRIRIANTNK